jgi:chromosome segregation ATPase
MGQLTVDSGQLTAEEQVEASLLQVHCELQDKIMKGMDSRFDDLREAYNTLQHVCRSVARCEGKSAAEWRDVAVAHQAALVETTATMNRYHGDWQKAVALVSDLQAQVTEFTDAPESVRVDGEKKGRLAAEERVLALEQQLREERAESSRTIAHLKDQWVEARELLSSNFANERAGLHGQLAELKARVAQLTMDNGQLTTKVAGAAELLAGVEVDAVATGPVADALRRQLAAAKGEEVLTRPGAPAATDGTDNTDGVVVEGGVV